MNDQSPSKRAVPEPTDGEALGTMDILGLLQRLPHRYPFLMVDRVIGIRGEDFGIGIKNVTYNEPQFTGHFPSRPIFPGIYLIEGMAQTAGAICVAAKIHERAKPKQVFFMTVDKCKFRKPARPGDRIEYHIKKLRRRMTMGWFEAKAIVDGVVIAEAEVGAMVSETGI